MCWEWGGDVIPGAARLISETAQRVHAIGQKQKNAQHLRRVQALLSGRRAKGLTSGSLPTSPSVLICPPLYSQHVPPVSSASLLFPWVKVLELHTRITAPPSPRSLVPTSGLAVGGASPWGASAPNVLPLL